MGAHQTTEQDGDNAGQTKAVCQHVTAECKDDDHAGLQGQVMMPQELRFEDQGRTECYAYTCNASCQRLAYEWRAV